MMCGGRGERIPSVVGPLDHGDRPVDSPLRGNGRTSARPGRESLSCCGPITQVHLAHSVFRSAAHDARLGRDILSWRLQAAFTGRPIQVPWQRHGRRQSAEQIRPDLGSLVRGVREPILRLPELRGAGLVLRLPASVVSSRLIPGPHRAVCCGIHGVDWH